jgi:hypothetical protein
MINNIHAKQTQTQNNQPFENVSNNWENSIIASRTSFPNEDEICPNPNNPPTPSSAPSKKPGSTNSFRDLKKKAQALIETISISPKYRNELQSCLDEIENAALKSKEYIKSHKKCISKTLVNTLIENISKLEKLVVAVEKSLQKQKPLNV